MDGVTILVKHWDRRKSWNDNFKRDDLYRIPGCTVPGDDLGGNTRVYVHQFAFERFPHSGTDSFVSRDCTTEVRTIIVWVEGPDEKVEEMVTAMAEKFSRQEAPA